MKKTVFITGISGQVGSYLAEHYLNEGWNVFGILRRHSVAENQESRIAHLEKDIDTDYGDLLDTPSLNKCLKKVKPDHICHLAAQSHVRISFDIPELTIQTNCSGTFNILEAYRQNCPDAKFYNMASSECFGNNVDEDGFQRETTRMQGTSPYGNSKIFAYNMTKHYRNAYNLFASNGIIFNTESERRGSNFVTAKITKTAVEIKLGLRDKLELGNLDTFRDFGHAIDKVKAIKMILDYDKSDDFVIATGEAHSVREFCDTVFSKLGMNYKEYIIQNPKYMRPEELQYLKGDYSKAKKILGWEPKISFESMIQRMIDYWFKKLS